MKMVLTWTNRASGDPEEIVGSMRSTLGLLADWQPNEAATIREWLVRADGTGGFCVLETEDLGALYRDLATWTPWLEFRAVPVLDIEEATPLLGEATAIAGSAA
jgi:hypothetical protein